MLRLFYDQNPEALTIPEASRTIKTRTTDHSKGGIRKTWLYLWSQDIPEKRGEPVFVEDKISGIPLAVSIRYFPSRKPFANPFFIMLFSNP